MTRARDIDRLDYPLPCDSVSGMGWWRFNLALCALLPGYEEWQRGQRMNDIIPTLRWLVNGAIPS